ncbi:hypothetical protein PFISCL1PPCAC_16550 [Pristionchus fissidentatus]|uniref:Uncharacterized protein n=1 Tax=Pristionchus fissidentatus TaxID=1538716 RepID=A0AAV5W3J2_9BILA|nr:hypothetical protein PFISCL1PPCAC_16550 [Pristionchus fissidentatus]
MPEEGDSSVHIPVRRRIAKNRPKDTAWRQQRLPAFRPVLNARCAFPITLVLGIACSIIGAFMYISANNSLEIVQDYTNCTDFRTGKSEYNGDFVPDAKIKCTYTLELKENYTGAVRFYYGLDGFYQNSRLYMASRSEMQLKGDLNNTEGCTPLESRVDPDDPAGKPIVPCGVIADSYFNGQIFFYTFFLTTTDKTPVPFTVRGIIDDYVRKRKFANPTTNGTLCDAFKGTVRPPSWPRDICQLGVPQTEGEADRESVGVGLENVDLIVWMRPAALPKFRKIYRILDVEADDFKTGLPAGNYTLQIEYNYPTMAWRGRKFFVIAAEQWAGGRHFSLAIAYMVVGVFLLLVSVLFLLMCLRIRFLERKHAEEQMQ